MGLRDRKLEETGENYDIGRACDMWEWVDVFKVLIGGGDMKERDHVEDVAVDGRIILKRILKKRDGKT